MKEFTLNRPNFLGSEKGLVTKTITIPNTQTTGVVEENGVKVCVKGTIFTTPYYGLLFEDTKVGEAGALMVSGFYIDSKLPSSASTYASNFKAQGLYAIVEPSAVLPNNGTVGLPKLTAPTVTDASSSKKITWLTIQNAIAYNVYKDNVLVATVGTSETLEYVYSTTSGRYTVVAVADNINYENSVHSNAVVVA